MKKHTKLMQFMAAILSGILFINLSSIGLAQNSKPKEDYQRYKKQMVQKQKQEDMLLHKVWQSNIDNGQDSKINYVQGEILVKFRNNFNPHQLFGTLGLVPLGKNSFNFYRVKVVREADFNKVLRSLKENKNVDTAQLNHIYRAYTYNDPMLNEQWSLNEINAPKSWNITKGSPKIKVAVVDTGVDLSHPEFQGRIETGYNAINPLKSPRDDDGHGTHVTGIVAAAINNQKGISGIAPNVKIIPVKVLDKSGFGTNYNIADGIKWAVDNGANIINLSLGGPEFSPVLDAAVQYAFAHNVLVVAAAGNDASDDMGYPAQLPNVFTVSATNNLEELAFFSNYGESNDISAPGMDIYSTFWDEQKGSTYAKFSGTSMASPLVAGLAADILSVNPKLMPQEVQQIIEESAKDLGDKGWDAKYGYGRIDAYQAIQLAKKYRPLVRGTWEKAALLKNGQLASGSIQTTYDVDYYQFNLELDGSMEVTGLGTKSQNLNIEVFDKEKQNLTTINYGKEGTEKALIPNLKRGKYFLRITDKGNHWGKDKYQIKVSQVAEKEQTQDLNEPNDNYKSAKELEVKSDGQGQITGVLSRADDVDWFKLSIKDGEKYQFKLAAQDGLDPIISVYSDSISNNEAIPVQGFDPLLPNKGSDQLGSEEVNSSEEELNLVQKIDNLSFGQGEEGTLENLPEGTYYLKLSDVNKNVVNQSYTLTYEKVFTSGKFDPFEPNDSPDTAIHLFLNGSLGGAKFTKDDVDWYTIEVKEQGVVNLDVLKNSKGSLDMAVYDDGVLSKGPEETPPLKIIWGEKQQIQGSFKVVPGQYFIRLMGNQFNWGEQYSINVHFEAKSFDGFEINDTPEKAAPIVMNNIYKGDLTLDDIDCYRIDLKNYQTVAVKVTPDQASDLTVAILKETKLDIPNLHDNYYELIQMVDTGGKGQLDAGIIKVVEEGAFIIQVRSKYTSKVKQNYSLLVNDYKLQKDAWENNNSRQMAKVITLNKTIKPTLLGPYDEDWYQLNIPTKKKVSVKLSTSKDIDGVLELFDGNGRKLAIRDEVMSGDAEILNFMASKGKYYLRITDVFGNGSLVPYTLETHF